MSVSHGERAIYSVGHSNHSLERFFELIQSAGITALVDTRSHPFSRHVPHFSRNVLARGLEEIGISYVFAGSQLGGRPEGEDFYDADGRVRYDRVAESAEFRLGIESLLDLASRQCVAIMCGEEDPTNCHRRLLIGRVLAERGVRVAHIRGDGRLTEDSQLQTLPSQALQSSLFPGLEESSWRSTRSVSQRGPLRTSSEP